MLTVAITAAVALAGLFVFFFLLKRTLRLFVRVALLGLLLLLLLAGGVVWWWYGSPGVERTPDERRAPAARPGRAR